MAAAQPVPRPLPVQAEFDQMSLTEIGASFKGENKREATIAWCRQYGLLATSMNCPNCGADCNQQTRNAAIDKKIWRCGNNGCRKLVSLRKGSFFEASKLELWKIIGLSYEWASSVGSARGMSQANLMRELSVASHTVVDWRQFMRDVAVTYFMNHPEQLGGPGVVVEIDESLFCRRKNNVGRMRQEMWVMGGYEQARRRGFLVRVDRRDAATLLPIIQQWVAPGSIIWSDMWAAYNQLPQLPNMAYQHGTVNHTLHFVDPNTGVTTNRVEAMWSRAKDKFKAGRGPTNREMVADYLAEFMWAQRFRGPSAFFNFYLQVARDLYPV